MSCRCNGRARGLLARLWRRASNSECLLCHVRRSSATRGRPSHESPSFACSKRSLSRLMVFSPCTRVWAPTAGRRRTEGRRASPRIRGSPSKALRSGARCLVSPYVFQAASPTRLFTGAAFTPLSRHFAMTGSSWARVVGLVVAMRALIRIYAIAQGRLAFLYRLGRLDSAGGAGPPPPIGASPRACTDADSASASWVSGSDNCGAATLLC